MGTQSTAKWRPSSLPSLALCPGWQSAPGTTDAAERGTRIHATIADVVSGRAPVPMEADGEATAVRYALEVLSMVRQQYPEHTLRAEVAVDAGVDGVHGTSDVCGVDGWGGDVLVVDWKSGWGDHGDAASSLQLVAYALGARAEFGHRGGAVLYLVDLDKRTTSVCRWSSADLDAARKTIQRVIAAAELHTDADLRPSKEACRYCARLPTCPAATGSALSVEVPALLVETMTPEDVGRVLDELEPRIKLAETVLAGLKQRAREMMEAGTAVPGWRLKTGSTRREWRVSADEARAAIPEVDLFDLVTPAQAERRITLALGGSKANAAQAREWVAPLVATKTTAPSVVRADEAEGAEA